MSLPFYNLQNPISLDKSVTVSDSQERISEEEQSHRGTAHISNIFQAVEKYK